MWLLAAVSAYFLLAIIQLVDKYLLSGPIPSPKVYAFFVGVLEISALVLAPFIGFYVPEKSQLVLSLLSGVIFIYALFWLFKALQLFEASRVIPAIGGLVPLFTLGLVYISSSGKEILSFSGALAFILLVAGSVLIVLEREKLITVKSLQFSALAAFLFSLSFVLTKYIYLAQPFWNGFIWRSMGGFLTAVCFFIFFPEIKKEILRKREEFPKKTAAIFLSNQAVGAGAAILQNWAIALAPIAYVAIINALQGVQYLFLFIFAIFLSLKFPQILKEEISKKILFQKICAILLIGIGLTILAFL